MELLITATRTGRLSSFLRGELKMSAGLMNRLKWGDGIRVNGVPRHTDFSVQIGDAVTVRLDEQKPDYPAQTGNLDILYEDAHILAADKPAGMLIHPSAAKNDGTMANFVAGYYAETRQNSAFHPVTRLDRDTFGIVLLAKNAYVHALLQETDIRKTYHALVFGEPAEDFGVIDAPVARREKPSLLREVRGDGKPSVTEFSVLERGNPLCRLALRPVTGRTHQLRVHCAHCGFPIVGDPQYGSAESCAYSENAGISHQILCAKMLEFTHPVTGENLVLRSRMNAGL